MTLCKPDKSNQVFSNTTFTSAELQKLFAVTTRNKVMEWALTHKIDFEQGAPEVPQQFKWSWERNGYSYENEDMLIDESYGIWFLRSKSARENEILNPAQITQEDVLAEHPKRFRRMLDKIWDNE